MMAGSPQSRIKMETDPALLRAAQRVPLMPNPDRCVFYADDDGAQAAAAWVTSHPAYQRLDDLLAMSVAGRALWAELTSKKRPWSEVQEVWWELSWRLARCAVGVVHVFGPARLIEDRPLEEFRHRYSTGSFANTVFEKVELPELEANPRVTRILYNGQAFG